MGAEVLIRGVLDSDSEQLAAIYNYYVAHTVITFEEQAVSSAEMAVRTADVQRRGLPWLVAEKEGKLMGYSYASSWKARSAYRHSVEATIYLQHGMEGRGIGKALYVTLLNTLRERGIHTVIGGAALPNDASVALHEHLGFERVATFKQVGFKHGRWVDVAYWQRIL